MMLKLSDNTIIYILCPANHETGGPEALHQLLDKLLKFKINAKMLYFPKMKNPTPPGFQKYRVEYTYDIIDTENNLLIVPEVEIARLNEYKRIQKAIYWLSVDNAKVFWNFNYIYSTSLIRNAFIKYKILSYPFLLLTFVWQQIFNLFLLFQIVLSRKKVLNLSKQKDLTHFAQCKAVENFLIQNGANYLYPLSDYISKEHFSNKSFIKENIVAYNPKKGKFFTDKLIKSAPHIKWVAIENMTALQVSQLLQKSKVYIDFGNHPGKDRIPREAALNNCCIITNIIGAASFFQDVSIPSEYKFKGLIFPTKKILNKIKYCLENYEDAIIDFEHYKKIIVNNESRFELEIKEAFNLSI